MVFWLIYIIYNGAHSVGILYQAQPSLGAERKRRTYTIRIRSEHYQHIAHRGLAQSFACAQHLSTLFTVSGVMWMAGGPEREEEELCHLEGIE